MVATRLDRTYATKELSARKIGVEAVAAAFTDHLAVLRIRNVHIVRRGRGFWKMDTSVLDDEAFKETLSEEWALSKQRRRIYADLPMWWGSYAKKRFVSFSYRKDRSAGGTS